MLIRYFQKDISLTKIYRLQKSSLSTILRTIILRLSRDNLTYYRPQINRQQSFEFSISARIPHLVD